MRRFAGHFESIVGFHRKSPEPPPPDCLYMPVEITSDESVQEGLRMIREHHGDHIASVIHLSAYYDFVGEPSTKYNEITVHGTERLLHGLRKLGFHVALEPRSYFSPWGWVGCPSWRKMTETRGRILGKPGPCRRTA